MALASGTRLGPYEVLAPIGAGGMGEVYRAKDTKLDREVAIKVLPIAMAQDRERLARFEREAKVLASLNHRNIAQIFGLEESGATRALVMELIQGDILKTPQPLETSLNYAKQISDALEAAHEKGITHRDLKPANIMVTPEGMVKVLDFGLASVPSREREGANDPANSPTLTLVATQAGMIMGTAAYMSPEQAAGKLVDKRSDIWSFGVLLWEMITGSKLFDCETISHTMADVLRAPIDFSAVTAPAPIVELLKRCLDRDVKTRLRDIGEARIAIERYLANPPKAGPSVSPAANWHAQVSIKLAWGTAAVLLVVALVTAYFAWGNGRQAQSGVAPTELALSIIPPPGQQLSPPGGLMVEKISADGSAVFFRANGRLVVRRLNSLATELALEHDWTGGPFWSSDSQSIAFPAVDHLWKMHLPRGAPVWVTQEGVRAERGGTWSADGTIILAMRNSARSNLYRTSAAGGTLSPIKVQGLPAGAYYNPEFLPGDRDLLFGFSPNNSGGTQIYLAAFRNQQVEEAKLLFNNDTTAAFTPAGGGRILFVRNDNLYSHKLDLGARKLAGEPELLQERVISDPGPRTANFSIANNGTLIWRSGTAVASQIAVFDRTGKRVAVAGSQSSVGTLRLSPDEAHLLTLGEAGGWIMEANGPGRVSIADGSILFALWSADGSQLLYFNGYKLEERALDETHAPRQLADLPASTGELLLPMGMSPDGERIVYGDGSKLYVLSLADHQSKVLTEQRVDNGALSPDGEWVVYRPYTEAGLYAQPISGTGLRRQIANRGNFAVWRGDGREITYYDQDEIWSVRVEGSGSQLRFSPPQLLFEVGRPLGLNSGSRPLAVNRDGSRIFFLQSTKQPDAGVIHVRTEAVR